MIKCAYNGYMVDNAIKDLKNGKNEDDIDEKEKSQEIKAKA